MITHIQAEDTCMCIQSLTHCYKYISHAILLSFCKSILLGDCIPAKCMVNY